MHAGTFLLAVVGCVCMMLALVLAWCLAGVRSSRFVKKCFQNPQYLLKAHLDFLMMTGLLFVFFLLFEHVGLTPPTAIVMAMSLGSLERFQLVRSTAAMVLLRLGGEDGGCLLDGSANACLSGMGGEWRCGRGRLDV
jgi:hypothetical protein